MEPKSKYEIYTDGGCSPNPGGPGGFGIVFLNKESGDTWEYSKGYSSTTNNRMELRAVLTALEIIRAKGIMEPFTLYSDSQYVIRVANGEWRKMKNQDLWARYDALSKGLRFRFVWVKGHNGNNYNERCDDLATKARTTAAYHTDDGYIPEKKHTYANNSTSRGGAMSAEIDIDDKYNDCPPTLSPEEYADRYNVHESCAKGIIDFYKEKKHTFKSYASLKTGGIDFWSRKKLDFLKENTGEDVYKKTTGLFSDEKDVLSCLKWRCRGLALKDAVRKILVDKEIADNSQHKHTKEPS